MRLICLLAICLLAIASISAAEEDMSSAQLVQFAVDKMGDSSQDAQVSGFDTASSNQIGYSSDGKVTQTISYENIGNGSIIQWGESGDMPREERSLSLDSVGDSGFTWQWSKGNVNQTINVRNSENLYLKQIIGGLKKILFPDAAPRTEPSDGWWFCGKAVNGTGGLPLCAEKIAKRINEGKANARDHYMLTILEEDYNIFPPENLTPHVVLTKGNITEAGGNLTIKFKAHNFGKKVYNATLMIDLNPRINVVGRNGKTEFSVEKSDWEIKVPEKKIIEIGNYTVQSMRDIEQQVTVPLNGTKIKNLNIRIMSE